MFESRRARHIFKDLQVVQHGRRSPELHMCCTATADRRGTVGHHYPELTKRAIVECLWRQIDAYLRALGSTPVSGAAPHGRDAWQAYTCGCRVPVGYPTYRSVLPCERHAAGELSGPADRAIDSALRPSGSL